MSSNSLFPSFSSSSFLSLLVRTLFPLRRVEDPVASDALPILLSLSAQEGKGTPLDSAKDNPLSVNAISQARGLGDSLYLE